MGARVARWPEIMVLQPNFDNIRIVGFYMMTSYRIIWGVYIVGL